MAGTIQGGRAAATTNKTKYGSDFYAMIGAKGGKKAKLVDLPAIKKAQTVLLAVSAPDLLVLEADVFHVVQRTVSKINRILKKNVSRRSFLLVNILIMLVNDEFTAVTATSLI